MFKAIKYFFHNPIVKAFYKNGEMTLEYLNGKTRKYQGSCTVWYDGIHRCGTLTESMIVGYWHYCKDGKEYIRDGNK